MLAVRVGAALVSVGSIMEILITLVDIADDAYRASGSPPIS